MAWTESGLMYASLRDTLKQTIAGNWNTATNKIALSSNSDTPLFQADPATWTNANEVSGTGWATGGIVWNVAAAGATAMTPAFSVTGTAPTTSLKWTFGANLAVSTTTLTNAYGAYLYMAPLSPQANICAIWFGGSAYSTVAGTFAITWSASGVITMALAA